MTSRPLDVTIVSPGMPHHGGTLAERSLGGSETAAIHIATALARQGHQVTAFSPGHQGAVIEGVQWLPIEMSPGYLRSAPHDICVISRDGSIASLPNAAGLTVLWCHDLALKRHAAAFISGLWQVGGLYVLSAFQKRQYLGLHAATEPIMLQTRNGIAPAAYEGLRDLERDPWKLVYGSRPERGLEVALRIMELSLHKGLPWTLTVAGYDNTTEQMRSYYASLWAACERLPNVRLAGPLKQRDWHKELATARALMYPGCPGPFREISGLVFLEAQMLGTPVVAVDKGAIPETLGPDSGIHLGDDDTAVDTLAYQQHFLEALSGLTDDAAWQRMHEAGPRCITEQRYSWDEIAAEWVADWRERLALRRASPWTVLRGCVRAGDHEAASLLEAA